MIQVDQVMVASGPEIRKLVNYIHLSTHFVDKSSNRVKVGSDRDVLNELFVVFSIITFDTRTELCHVG